MMVAPGHKGDLMSLGSQVYSTPEEGVHETGSPVMALEASSARGLERARDRDGSPVA